MSFELSELLDFMRGSRLGVISTLSGTASPQSALVGIATTDDHRVIFDTVSTSRKHANLKRNPHISLVIGGADEKTVQYEGHAVEVPTDGPDGSLEREVYFSTWPEGRDRLNWPNITYWCISPTWARYSDFGASPPVIVEFTWS
ncbi:MAG: hypothetical protein QOE79_2799 [Sphingomonadales bacterium]|nr:hypothetical protein [Sphingomonadales bacterium]MEA3048403.1 hypothetical protein [Sphingomonadales bacterium]